MIEAVRVDGRLVQGILEQIYFRPNYGYSEISIYLKFQIDDKMKFRKLIDNWKEIVINFESITNITSDYSLWVEAVKCLPRNVQSHTMVYLISN